jgi:S-(hydroxymethyl)glutathione dehydrogenase/alcohol dehydrogenase
MKTRAAVAFAPKQPLEIDPMIIHALKLDEINRAFDVMHSGESIRSVVVF